MSYESILTAAVVLHSVSLLWALLKQLREVRGGHSRVQKVVKIILMHCLDTKTIVVFEQALHGVIQGAVHAPLTLECVRFTLGA